MIRICYNCGATKTYIDKKGHHHWYHDKKGNWQCSKCRHKLVTNPKWHKINNAKRSKEEAKANRRNVRIHNTINKDLRRIPVTSEGQYALHKEYKITRARDLRANYRTPAIDSLLRSISKVKDVFTTWQPEYDKKYFDSSRFELERTESTKLKDSELLEILQYLNENERESMQEALDCAANGFMRASVVLGWASAIYRMHCIIEKMGFDNFNKKSKEISDIREGRFKKYDTVFHVRNFSDLQATVSDSALLWVLEYCEFIDYNQHERLDACFTMRNTSAHPNSTKITYANVKSFFSDLKQIVFANKKLQIGD